MPARSHAPWMTLRNDVGDRRPRARIRFAAARTWRETGVRHRSPMLVSRFEDAGDVHRRGPRPGRRRRDLARGREPGELRDVPAGAAQNRDRVARPARELAARLLEFVAGDDPATSPLRGPRLRDLQRGHRIALELVALPV